MKTKIILIAFLLFMGCRASAKNRIIYGRVISEELEPVTGAKIKIDTLILGKTDAEGRFRISIPENTKTISFLWIGQERTVIYLNKDCDNIEVIMMDNVTYDYISLKNINKLRLIRFNKLPGLHVQAYKKGIFTKETICYSMEFEPPGINK